MECPVCSHEFTSEDNVPKMIPCGHTFCGKCLLQLCEDGTITCPKCEDFFQAAKHEIPAFPTNFLALETTPKPCPHCARHTRAPRKLTAADLKLFSEALDNLHLVMVSTETLHAINKEIDYIKRQVSAGCDEETLADPRTDMLMKADKAKQRNTAVYNQWKSKSSAQQQEGFHFSPERCDLSQSISTLMDVQQSCDSLMVQLKFKQEIVPAATSKRQDKPPYQTSVVQTVSSVPPTQPLAPPLPLATPTPQYDKAKLAYYVGGKGTVLGKYDGIMGICSLPFGGFAVVDSENHRVQFLNEQLEHKTSYGSFGTRGEALGQLDYPVDVTSNRHELFVSDKNNNRVYLKRMMATNTAEGWQCQQFITIGSRGSGPSQLKNPAGLTVAPDNRLYICDKLNGRIQVVHHKYATTLVRTGTGQGQLRSQPQFISTNHLNHIIVTDNDGHLYVYDSDGRNLKTMWKGETGSFCRAAATVTDPWGNLIVADTDGGCVLVIDSGGNIKCRIGNNSQMEQPVGLALSQDGDLVVTDRGLNTIFKFEVPKLIPENVGY